MGIRSNLLVTAGARAAYMDCNGTINLPSGTNGDDALAEFIEEKVNNYIEGIDEPFDLYIERELISEYGEKKDLNEYHFKVRLCDGYQCGGKIAVVAENEDVAQDMALEYVCERLADALPDLDVEVSVELLED